jgi:hypothetical protein
MGCACLKSEVVVKNQKIPKHSNSESPKIKGYENARAGGSNVHNMNQFEINIQSLDRYNNNHDQIYSQSNRNANSRKNQNSLRVSEARSVNNNNTNNLNEILRSMMVAQGEGGMRIGGPSFEPYLISKNDPEFNFPEIEDVYVGNGIKKMKGYICRFTHDELERKRKEFWSNQKLILF